MKKYGFGVDVGGTTIKVGFFETDGKLLDKWEVKTNTEEGGRDILPDIAQAIDNKLAQEGISKNDVQGIGIGVPGPVTADGVVHSCVNLGWGTVNVAEQLGSLTGMSVQVGNDANVAALGEMWQGGAKGSRDVIVVTLGTGVGGGIIVDGKIVAGFNGAGGEIGHITVNNDEIEPCNCGQYGCLEQYTSATGIVRMAKRKLAKTNADTSLRDFDGLTAKDIFDEAKKGDEVAAGLVDELGEILGAALSNMACVVNPEVIVIGGGVSKAGQILIDTIQKHFIETSFHACRETRFALATLGNDAGMYGCMQMILA
ncbi:MAG: ROK family glucokinase [Muribaculaceae bacterium]|nr:ROK family glucokinase [Roseburia sp.]MCM1431340.1 ROK family glucokinase [Muribaculaceae bacterium]MCM1491782.1 ROK family glucokinase [Muribaculaceae bacterium]